MASQSKFTRRHYIAIAEVMASEFTQYEDFSRDMVWVGIVSGLSMMFQQDNPNFDKVKFIQACAGK